jgi:hypothetical protein
VTEKTSAWAAERESRIPGYFYTAIEGSGPKEYSGVLGAAKTSDLLLNIQTTQPMVELQL